jgi:hypothetical protein
MIGFLIKKSFFDLWDNLLRIILINLGFTVFLGVPVFLPGLLEAVPPLSLLVFFAGTLWCFVYLAAAALSLRAVSDYGTFGPGDFLRNLKAGWPAGVFMGTLFFLIQLVIRVVIPFYLGMNSPLGLLLTALIFWTLVICGLSLQFFFAVRARLDTKLFKVLKKCFIILFDNPGFCIFLCVFHLAVLGIFFLLSFLVPLVLGPAMFLAFLVPGPAGLLLSLDEALRLRLLKYDWLEANPQAAEERGRRKIPWDAILIDEREKTGTRSLKNFIFPWKD